jgi:hypothetical protein
VNAFLNVGHDFSRLKISTADTVDAGQIGMGERRFEPGGGQ